MSRTCHLSSDYVPDYTLSDSHSFSSSAVSRRTLAIVPCSSCLDHKLRIKNERLECVPNSSSFVCRASPGGYRRNPDFSRLDKHGFRGRNRQSESRDDFDIENSEMSSRNGSLLSLSNSPKFKATSSPGPREKEIVELFRKVQAQLRARAAAKKEEKKIEQSSKGQGKEIETVDSLLKLLRKHSGEQTKKKSPNFSSQGEVQGDSVDKQDRSGNLVSSGNNDYNASSFTRPTSSFRKKSPVPRSKSPPAYSNEATFDEASSYSVTWTQKKDKVVLDDESEPEPEPEYEYEPEYESEPGPVTAMLEIESELKPKSPSFYQEEEDDVTLDVLTDDDVTLDVLSDVSDDEEALADADDDGDEAEEAAAKVQDLSTMKLIELRGIAKSRGLKGVSKMKKAELLELLGPKKQATNQDKVHMNAPSPLKPKRSEALIINENQAKLNLTLRSDPKILSNSEGKKILRKPEYSASSEATLPSSDCNTECSEHESSSEEGDNYSDSEIRKIPSDNDLLSPIIPEQRNRFAKLRKGQQ